jgi:hypothetical protein
MIIPALFEEDFIIYFEALLKDELDLYTGRSIKEASLGLGIT